MVDAPEPVQMDEAFLWPSPEMRQRAIDEAIKVVSLKISESTKKEIETIIDVAAKKVYVDIEAKAADLKKLIDEGNKVLNAIHSVNQNDFTKLVESLSVRLNEIEQQLLKDNDQSLPGFSGEYDAKNALKNICEIIRDIVNSVRGDQHFNTIAYNLSDYQLKGRILGQLITEHAKYQLGTRLDKLEQIGNTASRL
jgi:Mg2+ and Co2+ transporter CorA